MNNTPKPQLMIWWFLWISFLVGICVIYNALGKQAGSRPDPFPWQWFALPVFFSMVVRWIVLPRINQAQMALVAFVLGIAFAESACFMGLFIVPSHRADLFLLSALGIFQFMPYFAGRFYGADRE